MTPDNSPAQAALGQDVPATAAGQIPHPSDAERRQLTVLFCDLMDSTRLASQLDADDYREVVRAYQQTCAEVIQRFEGHIAQYLGDGLLVYFGYPQAHEDDAQRAVRAGLGILDAMGTLHISPERDKIIRLAVRIGIHTGPVVVGAMGSGGRHEQLALGETPNLAARLQSLAAPDTVAISATTHRLVQGYFGCDDLGSPRSEGGRDAPARVPRGGRKRRPESPRRGRGHRAYPPGGPGNGGDDAAGALGTEPATGWDKWCCSAARPALANRAWWRSCANG